MNILKFTTTALLIVFLFFPTFTLAQDKKASLEGLNVTAGEAGLIITGTERPDDARMEINKIIGTIINAILGFTGVIFLVLIIAAGELWLTAGGNSEQTEKARGLIFNAVIGLLIVFGSYLATNYAVPFVLTYTGIF